MSFEHDITNKFLTELIGLSDNFNFRSARHLIPKIYEHEIKRLLPDAQSFQHVLGELAGEESIKIHPSYFLAKPYILLSFGMDTIDQNGVPTGLIAANNMQYRVRMAYESCGKFYYSQANMKDLLEQGSARREFEAMIDCDSPGCEAIDNGLPELLQQYDSEGVLPSFLYEDGFTETPLAVSALCMTKRTQIYLFHALTFEKGKATSGVIYEVCADTSYFASPDAQYTTGRDHELELEAKEIFCTKYAPTDEQKIEMLEASANKLGDMIAMIEPRAQLSPLSKLQRANGALDQLVIDKIYSDPLTQPQLPNVSPVVAHALSLNLTPSKILYHHKQDLTHLIRLVERCDALITPECIIPRAA